MSVLRYCRPWGAVWVSGVAVVMALGTAAWGAEQGEQESEKELHQRLEEAQQRLNEAAREVADLSMALSDEVLPRVMPFVEGIGAPRAALGIVIPSSRSNKQDDGVEVLSVSPGGPAAEAGLKAGDVLIEIDGQSLRREGETSPPAKLRRAMREVNAGDTVSLEYRRDGKAQTAKVAARPPERHAFSFTMPSFGAMPGRMAFMRAEGVFGTAELAPLTPQLGRYFGTEEGLLVVRAPADARLQLEDGDVIVDIDGRVPSSPGHAMRILGSYQAGETVKLNVLRMKKRMSFEVTIPQDAWQERLENQRFRPGVIEPAVPLVPVRPDPV